MTSAEPKTECRTPTKDKSGVTRIPRWKYDLLSQVIREEILAAGDDGMRFSDLKEAVRVRISQDELRRLGSLGWHVTTVKLEMEVRGDIARLDKTPQTLIIP